MKVIKDYVRSKGNPEGCIAKENVVEEKIEFFSEFIKNMLTVGIPLAKPNNNGIVSGEDTSAHMDKITLLAGKMVKVTLEPFNNAHFYVLQNTTEVEPYIK